MKKLLFILISLLFVNSAFSQDASCCRQVIVSKTNKPFKCLETQKDSIVKSVYPRISAGEFHVSEDIWGYKGMMIKTLEMGAMAEPFFRPGYIITIDDACNVVCNTGYQMLYNPNGNPVIRTEIFGSNCNPTLIKVNPATGIGISIPYVDAIKLDYRP